MQKNVILYKKTSIKNEKMKMIVLKSKNYEGEENANLLRIIY